MSGGEDFARHGKACALRTRAPTAQDDCEITRVNDAVAIDVGARILAAIAAPRVEDRSEIDGVDGA